MTEYINICKYTPYCTRYHVCFAACVPYTPNTFHDSLVPLKNGPHWGGVSDRWSTLHWERWTETHFIQRLGRLEDAWQWQLRSHEKYTSWFCASTRWPDLTLVNFVRPLCSKRVIVGAHCFFLGWWGGAMTASLLRNLDFFEKSTEGSDLEASGATGGRLRSGSWHDHSVANKGEEDMRKIGLQQKFCYDISNTGGI